MGKKKTAGILACLKMNICRSERAGGILIPFALQCAVFEASEKEPKNSNKKNQFKSRLASVF